MSKLPVPPPLPPRLCAGADAQTPATRLERACMLLTSLLTSLLAAGPQPQADLQAQVQGISESTLKRAKQALAVRSEKRGGGPDLEAAHWVWSLPAMNAPPATIVTPSQWDSTPKTDLPPVAAHSP